MTADGMEGSTRPHSMSIVIPVYRGERTLPTLIAEIEPLAAGFTTSQGHRGTVDEMLLVTDNGPDDSPRLLRELAERHPFDRASGSSSFRSLTSQFWRMVLSGEAGALRLVSLLGMAFAVGGFLSALYFLVAALVWDVSAPGWPSLMVALLVCGGAVLFSLGVIAEYIGVAVNMAMGEPPYLIVSDPISGPLGRIPAPVAPPPDMQSGQPGSSSP